MMSKALLVVSTAVGFLTAAQADCTGSGDWANGPNCVSGNGDPVTEDLVADFASCMKTTADDDGTYTIEGNGVIPPSGSGKMVTWIKDGHQAYLINSKMDDACVDLTAMGDELMDGYEDDCLNIEWDNGDDWNLKMGVEECDVVYGCGNTAYRTYYCS